MTDDEIMRLFNETFDDMMLNGQHAAACKSLKAHLALCGFLPQPRLNIERVKLLYKNYREYIQYEYINKSKDVRAFFKEISNELI